MKISVLGLGVLAPQNGLSLLDFDLKNYPVSPKTYLDRASALALGAAGLALQNANLTGPFDENFGLCIGTQFGCVETMRTFENTLAEKGARGASPLLFSHSYFNSPAALIAIEWNLKGYHAPLVGEDSGWQAIETARDAIELGHATRMLCGAFDALSPTRALSGEENAGEAAVFCVLEKGENGQNFEDVFGQPRDHFANFGAVGEILARLKSFEL